MGSASSQPEGPGPDAPSQPEGPGPEAPEEAEAAASEPVRVIGLRFNGSEVPVVVGSSDPVRVLKQRLSEAMGGEPRAYQLKLILGDCVLKDAEVLSKLGVADGAVVTIVVGQPLPDWAEHLGLEPEHPAWVRTYFAGLGVQADWLDDDAQIWEKLRQSEQDLEAQRENRSSWSHQVWLVQDGRRVGQVRASPGQDVHLEVEGFIWNLNGDSCIHQCGLVLGRGCVGELYHGVPGRGYELSWRGTVKAPLELGPHMLYRFTELQYSFADARRNFEERSGEAVKESYPGRFVGWLIVE